MSTIQNRTFEFQQCVTSYDKINKKNNISKPASAGKAPVKKTKFSQYAGGIASDISHVTELLSKLALLAKRKPLLDDKPREIGQMTSLVKLKIFKIEKDIQELQRFMKGDATSQVDPQTSQFSKNVVNLLNSKMKNVSGEFKNVLEVRQKNEILNKNRSDNFLSHSQASRAQSPAGLNNIGENPYLAPQGYVEENYSSNPDNINNNPYSSDYLNIPDQTQQLLLMEEQPSQYLHERNLAVETIESTINEVGNLFHQLASMVSEQGEQIQRIDQNVEDISINITGAQRELLKYYAHITSNRWLFLKIFGVLIMFFFLWVMVS